MSKCRGQSTHEPFLKEEEKICYSSHKIQPTKRKTQTLRWKVNWWAYNSLASRVRVASPLPAMSYILSFSSYLLLLSEIFLFVRAETLLLITIPQHLEYYLAQSRALKNSYWLNEWMHILYYIYIKNLKCHF